MKKYCRIAALSLLFFLPQVQCGWGREGNVSVPVNGELGIGYGRQIRGDIDLNQVEIYWRQPLPLNRQWGEWQIKSKMEFAAAYFTEEDNHSMETIRFSVMPQLFFEHGTLRFIAGFGAGVMAGDTEYPQHNLGGEFLLNSKLAMQFALADNYGLELGYYHQSNAGIYEHNASLNMISFSLGWYF